MDKYIDWRRLFNLGREREKGDGMSMGKDSKRLRVCVVDDEEDVIQTVKRVCEINGYDVMGINSTIGCSAQINLFKPHILLLDLMMPALKGTTLLQLLRTSLTPMPKVILFSGSEPEVLEKTAALVGADGFFFKGNGLLKLTSFLNLLAHDLKEARA